RAEGAWNVRWVWSPAGNSGAEAYYPGSDVVDFVGITILSDAGWERAGGYPQRPFQELLAAKYRLAETFDKPIIVAELGVSGTTEAQQAWLAQGMQALGQFPRL